MNKKTYWFGETVKSKDLYPLDLTFSELVNKVLERKKTLSITSVVYHGCDDKKTRNMYKDGLYLIAAKIDQYRPVRTLESTTGINLIILDIDTHKEATHVLNLIALATAGQTSLLSDEKNWLCYNTLSSRPTHTRLRLMIDVNDFSVDDYSMYVKAVGAELGLDEVSPESLNPVLPMYLPVNFKGE